MNETIEIERINSRNVLVKEKVKPISGVRLYTYLFIKRIFDIICGLIGTIVLIPILIVVKIVTILSGDFHSIFFIQERIGINGKKFKMFKFRTMIPNADKVLEKMLKEDKKVFNEYSKYKKLSNDPRITKIGNILRISSLDEFPQFINILFGQMSLVGPRPYLFREKVDMGKSFNKIVVAKPGLTGLWQVRGRSNTDFKDRLIYDIEYVAKRSLRLDIKILLRTVKTVLIGDGAL